MKFKSSSNNAENLNTPKDDNISSKSMGSRQIKSQRVDINNLRLKLEHQESKEFKKNLIIFIFCIFLLGTIGVYLSL